MCQSLNMIAHRGDRRLIAQCEHGTLHLIWNRATFMLHPTNFTQFVSVLQFWRDNPAEPQLSLGPIRLQTLSNGSYQLWIADAGLEIAAADLQLLAAMASEAGVRHMMARSETGRSLMGQTRAYVPFDPRGDGVLQN